jgi:hypothetical protein
MQIVDLLSILENHVNVLVCGAEIKCVLLNKKTGTVSLESEPADTFDIDPSQYTVLWEA